MLRGRKRTGSVGESKGGAHCVSGVVKVTLIIAKSRRTEAFRRRVQGEMVGLIPA